ncbi:hypothetical protein G6F43_013851 [Rhizopus delemar]|nr:hypothetical protein G6F43_013851 [Rhizopus delemar]
MLLLIYRFGIDKSYGSKKCKTLVQFCKLLYDGIMNSEVYQEILGTSLKDTMEYYGLNWETSVFQHDNDPKHRSKSTTQWMKDSGMIYIDDWPSQSPDLNPIEHIWHHLKLKLSMYDNRATSIHELWQRVENEWNSFTKILEKLKNCTNRPPLFAEFSLDQYSASDFETFINK